MTSVARSVFMLRTTVATSDTVNVLIALKNNNDEVWLPGNTISLSLSHLAAVFREINASSEHSTNVSVTLIKSFLDDCLEMFDKQTVGDFTLVVVTWMKGDPWNNILSLL